MLDSVAKLQFVKLSANALSDGTAMTDPNSARLSPPWPVRDRTESKYPLKDLSEVASVKPSGDRDSVRWSAADVLWLEESVRSRLDVLAGGRGDGKPLSIGDDAGSGNLRLRRFLAGTLRAVSDMGPLVWLRHEPDGLYGWLKGGTDAFPVAPAIKLSGNADVADPVGPMARPSEASDPAALLRWGNGVSSELGVRIDAFVSGGLGPGWSDLRDMVKRDFLSPDVLSGWHLADGRVVQDPDRAYSLRATPKTLAAVYSDLESCRVCAVPPLSVRLGSPQDGPEDYEPAENSVTVTTAEARDYTVVAVPGTGTRTGELQCAGGGDCDGSPCVSGTYSVSITLGGFAAKETKPYGQPGHGGGDESVTRRVPVQAESLGLWDGTAESLARLAKMFCARGVGDEGRLSGGTLSVTTSGSRGAIGTQLTEVTETGRSTVQVVSAKGIIPVDGRTRVDCGTSGRLVLGFYGNKDVGFPAELDVKNVKVLAVVGRKKMVRRQSMESLAKRPSTAGGGSFSILASGGAGGEICECNDGAAGEPGVWTRDEEGNPVYDGGSAGTGSTVCGQAGSVVDTVEAYPSLKDISYEYQASERRQVDIDVFVKAMNASFRKAEGTVVVSGVGGSASVGGTVGASSVDISDILGRPSAFEGCGPASLPGESDDYERLGKVETTVTAEVTEILAVGPAVFEVEFKNTSLRG